jgi:hypothetical protein
MRKERFRFVKDPENLGAASQEAVFFCGNMRLRSRVLLPVPVCPTI